MFSHLGRLTGSGLLAATEAASGSFTLMPAAWGGEGGLSHSPTDGKALDTQPRAIHASSER